MNEELWWILKVIFFMYCVWFIWGGPARIKSELMTDKKTAPIQRSASVYQPKVYQQTIILH